MKAEEVMEIETAEPRYSNEHDLVRGVATTIAILKATAMRMLWTCSDVPALLHVIQGLQEKFTSSYATSYACHRYRSIHMTGEQGAATP